MQKTCSTIHFNNWPFNHSFWLDHVNEKTSDDPGLAKYEVGTHSVCENNIDCANTHNSMRIRVSHTHRSILALINMVAKILLRFLKSFQQNQRKSHCGRAFTHFIAVFVTEWVGFFGVLIYRSLAWAKDLEKTRFQWKVSVKFTQELCCMWNNVIWTGLYIYLRVTS